MELTRNFMSDGNNPLLETMEEQKLVSMVDFVLEQEKKLIDAPINEAGVKQLKKYITSTSNYANFLKQPLTLGMFIACDLEGNVLEKPNRDSFHNSDKGDYLFRLYTNQFQQAKERVLFEGFRIVKKSPHYDWHITNKDGNVFIYLKGLEEMTIQSLVKRKPTLTPTACKQIGIGC